MATKNIVPRGDNEGGLGTTLKRWASGFFVNLSAAALRISGFASAGYVRNDADGVFSGGNSISAGDLPAGINAAKIASGTVSNAKFGYLAGVTSDIQTQLAGKLGHVKVGWFVRDTSLPSGEQTVAGIGFTPRAVIFFMSEDSVVGETSWGMDDGASRVVVGNQYNITPGRFEVRIDNSIADTHSLGNVYYGHISVFNADGFVVSWSRIGAPTGVLYVLYLALG